MAASERGCFASYGYSRNLKKNLKYFVDMYWVTLYQMLIGKQNMVARGRGCFALYGCSGNFKNLLRNCFADFQIIL